MTVKKSLTAEQMRAVQYFAKQHGRNWKSALSDAWMRAGIGVVAYTPALQQVRNNFGPAWLVKFKLPKEVE